MAKNNKTETPETKTPKTPAPIPAPAPAPKAPAKVTKTKANSDKAKAERKAEAEAKANGEKAPVKLWTKAERESHEANHHKAVETAKAEAPEGVILLVSDYNRPEVDPEALEVVRNSAKALAEAVAKAKADFFGTLAQFCSPIPEGSEAFAQTFTRVATAPEKEGGKPGSANIANTPEVPDIAPEALYFGCISATPATWEEGVGTRFDAGSFSLVGAQNAQAVAQLLWVVRTGADSLTAKVADLLAPKAERTPAKAKAEVTEAKAKAEKAEAKANEAERKLADTLKAGQILAGALKATAEEKAWAKAVFGLTD